MMRSVLLALMFSGSVFALSADAFAQSSPDTRQTDQSEEDWRKSKKKGGSSTEEILDIIKNTRSSGVGNGRGYSPIDALPEESRRHLMKERAKRMAQAGPNEPVDVTFKPSEAAKSDSNLEADEKAAWEEMSKSMNGVSNQGQQGQDNQGQGPLGQSQNDQAGQNGQGQVADGAISGSTGQQTGQQGSQGQQSQQQDNGQSRSVMRGGSAASVSDIMNRIKGLGQSTGGTGQEQGEAQQGQAQQGQAQQGQAQQAQSSQGESGQGTQGQSPSQNENQSQAENQSQSDSSAQAQSEAQDQAQAEAQTEAMAEAKSQSQSDAVQETPEVTNAASNAEPISPLDRIKKVNREQNTSGRRSSASDYLKKSE
jgi:hypothetical protein